jgi:hypothetical protein
VVQGAQTADSNPIWIIDGSGQGPTGPPPGSSAPAATAASTGVSAGPTNAAESVSQQSASIAATASTLVTTMILGTTITAQPDSAAPTGNSTSNPTDGGGGGGGLSGGAIAGIVIGVVVFLAFICALVWFMRRRMQKSRRSHTDPSNLPGKSETDYATPAAMAGGTVAAGAAGTSRGLPNDSKPELHADDKPLRTSPGLHEMPSPGGSDSPTATRAPPHSRSVSSPSDHSGSADDYAASNELVGSPVGSLPGVSPQAAHSVPRKKLSANDSSVGDGIGTGRPPTIHEMG